MLLSGTTHYPDHDVTSEISSGGGGTSSYQYGNLTDISSSTISGNVARVPDTDRSGGGGLFDDGEATYDRSADRQHGLRGNRSETPGSRNCADLGAIHGPAGAAPLRRHPPYLRPASAPHPALGLRAAAAEGGAM